MPSNAPGNNRAYLLPDAERAQLHPGLVVPEDLACGQVDEQQRPRPLLPVRRLAHIGTNVGKYLDPHTRRAGHLPPCLRELNNPEGARSGRLQHSKPSKRLPRLCWLGRLTQSTGSIYSAGMSRTSRAHSTTAGEIRTGPARPEQTNADGTRCGALAGQPPRCARSPALASRSEPQWRTAEAADRPRPAQQRSATLAPERQANNHFQLIGTLGATPRWRDRPKPPKS
jgi:hypothetical protein